MTLDDAIRHAEDVAATCSVKGCALDHAQLAAWLKELRDYKGGGVSD